MGHYYLLLRLIEAEKNSSEGNCQNALTIYSSQINAHDLETVETAKGYAILEGQQS